MTKKTAKKKLAELEKEMEDLREYKGVAACEMDWMARLMEIQNALGQPLNLRRRNPGVTS